MKFGMRLWILIVALFLVSGGTIYGLYSAWHRLNEVSARLNTSEAERYQLAGQIHKDLVKLNESLMSYALVRDPRKWAEFEQASGQLDRWIDEHDPSLNPRSPLSTAAERDAFQELNKAYDGYVSAAQAVRSNTQPALVTAAQLAQLGPFNLHAQEMRSLVHKLDDAHHSAQADFFATANTALAKVQLSLIAGIMMLLGLVAAMGCVIYRDTIAPLRTKLVQSQSLLEKQEKLATLGTLAAGIAHEIRNPLTSLKARLYTLEKHLTMLPAAKRDTEIINSEISRLDGIVHDILRFARPSDPKLETISAEDVLREVHGLMTPGLEARHIKLVMEPGAPLFIRADSSHLKQILVNLVRNAAEAIDTAGSVTLRARSGRALLCGHQTEVAILEVSDDGRGITPEVEKRLFDPFFSTKSSGTGLGLSIAASIVQKLGGALQYRTQPGRGTTFGIVLPRQSANGDGSGVLDHAAKAV